MQKRVIVLLLGFVIAAVAVARADRPEPVAPRSLLSNLPMQLGDWTGVSLPPFTPRELEVAALVADGLSNRQIAERLVFGERTAEAHVAHCLAKLGLESRAQLAAWAVLHGLEDRPAQPVRT